MSELITSDYWAKTDKIRQIFAPNLSTQEFAAFIGMGKSLGANPFNREIWAVKYGGSPAQIFLGRDFYRRKAQEQPDFRGHQVDVIYEKDTFKMEGGKPIHTYDLKERMSGKGNILGAYCVVYRADNEPYFNVVSFKEYFAGGKKNPNLWDTKPETMIKKVAEAQALRGAFQGVFAGTYDESEEWTQEGEHQEVAGNFRIQSIPEEAKHLIGRYPFDKTLKAPKDAPHKPYLGDSTPAELDLVEADIRDYTLDPRYVRFFYTVSNRIYDYLQDLPGEILELDRAASEL